MGVPLADKPARYPMPMLPRTDPAGERREEHVVAAVAVAILALIVWRATMGTNFYDGSFYVVVPLRIAQGARVFADEMAIQALGSLVAVPFVKVWTALFGLTAIQLAVQLYYVAIATVAGFVAYRLLRPTFRPAAAALAIGIPLLAPPYHLIAPSYNTIAELSFMLATCLAFAAVRDDSRAKAALSGVALVVGTLSYPPLVIAALLLFAAFAVAARRSARLVADAFVGGLVTAAVLAAALFSAVSVTDVRAALAFALANVGKASAPLAKLRFYDSNVVAALLSAWLIPMWLLALAASITAVPRKLRAIALAALPVTAAIPGVVLVAQADGFTFGTAAATWYITFVAGALVPVTVWATRRSRVVVLQLMAMTAPFAAAGFLTIAYSTNSSWNRGVPVIVLAAFGIGLIAGWFEALAEGGPWVASAGSAAALVAVLGLLFATIFGDAGLLLPRVSVTSGPYAGLTTDASHLADIRELTAAGQRWVGASDRVLFLGIREGYLLVGGTIDTNAVWLPAQASDKAALDYFSRPGNVWPRVVFVDDEAVNDDGGYPVHAGRDPLLARILVDYRRVGKAARYSVFVRR